MFCKECGTELSDNAVVCVKCGAATDNFNKTKTGDVSNAFIIWAYIIAVIFPLGGIAMGVYALVKRKTGHGIGILVLAMFFIFFWIGFTEAM
jgi:hypothetical protein